MKQEQGACSDLRAALRCQTPHGMTYHCIVESGWSSTGQAATHGVSLTTGPVLVPYLSFLLWPLASIHVASGEKRQRRDGATDRCIVYSCGVTPRIVRPQPGEQEDTNLPIDDSRS